MRLAVVGCHHYSFIIIIIIIIIDYSFIKKHKKTRSGKALRPMPHRVKNIAGVQAIHRDPSSERRKCLVSMVGR
jgi:hypothetical protein